VWKVSKWKNGLPQRQDWDQILPWIRKIGDGNDTDASNSVE
jgi:hypothetical protein